MEISKIDNNFSTSKEETNVTKTYKAPSKHFKLFGILYDKDVGFHRLPLEIAKQTNENTYCLSTYPSGGRVVFAAN